MDINKISDLTEANMGDLAFINQESERILQECTPIADARKLVNEIKAVLLSDSNPSDYELEKAFAAASCNLPWFRSQLERFAAADPLTKYNAKVTYNQAYTESQINTLNAGKKATKDDHQVYAENNSINETMQNVIWSSAIREFRAIVESIEELNRTLSKLYSKRVQEANDARFSRKIQDNE